MTTPSPPPGTGGTTLVDELEQAARLLKNRADTLEDRDHDVTELRAFYSRLRARAARVRELVTSVEELAAKHGDNVVTPSQIIAGAYRALTGPLSPTEPAATPTEPKP